MAREGAERDGATQAVEGGLPGFGAHPAMDDDQIVAVSEAGLQLVHGAGVGFNADHLSGAAAELGGLLAAVGDDAEELCYNQPRIEGPLAELV